MLRPALLVLLIGCDRAPAAADYRAYCEKERACTGVEMDVCLEGRTKLAAELGRCRSKGDDLLRCMAEHARCERAGTMAFLFPTDACRAASEALTVCRAGR
ncbi:MAG: hypothetical protein HYV09_13115 [Deltaproteobacteria bacterium]|nr:hypothetical protein [Deltaproteobacteria bacterium]